MPLWCTLSLILGVKLMPNFKNVVNLNDKKIDMLIHRGLILVPYGLFDSYKRVYNNCCQIHFSACQIIEIQYSTSFEP